MRLLHRLRPFLPWLSLVTGVGGALLMNRAPGRAWVVIVAAVLGWAMLVVFNVVERAWSSAHPLGDAAAQPAAAQPSAAPPTANQKRARFAILLSNQIAVQQALLFPLPFYVRAAQVHIGHLLFFAAYAAALVVVLWDPLFAAVMKRAPGAFLLQAFAAFVGLNMVLPVFGLSNSWSFIVAGAATALGVPLLVVLELAPVARRRWLAAPGALFLVLLARVAAPLVPPAPLELVHAGIGTGVVDKALVGEAAVLDAPAGLVCHSAIKAPLGLKDALVHVWWKDGQRIDAIPVEVSGGRDAGFRTWSKKRSLGERAAGHYLCVVETASGQVLGRAETTVR